MVEDRRSYSRHDFSSSAARILGGIQIFVGVLCMVLNIVGLVNHMVYYFYVSHGLVCGAIFCLAGCFGVAAAYTRSKKLILVFTVLSTPCAALLSPTLIVIEAVFLAKVEDIFADIPQEAMVLHVALICLAFVEFIVSLGASFAYCHIIRPRFKKSHVTGEPQVYILETPTISEQRLLPSSDSSVSNISMQYSLANPDGGSIIPLQGHAAMFLISNSSTSTLSM